MHGQQYIKISFVGELAFKAGLNTLVQGKLSPLAEF